MRGYRTYRNGLRRTDDYGIREYKTFVLAMATPRPTVGIMLELLVFFAGLRGVKVVWIDRGFDYAEYPELVEVMSDWSDEAAKRPIIFAE